MLGQHEAVGWSTLGALRPILVGLISLVAPVAACADPGARPYGAHAAPPAPGAGAVRAGTPPKVAPSPTGSGPLGDVSCLLASAWSARPAAVPAAPRSHARLLAGGQAAARAPAPRFPWPIALRPALSSTFGETRSGHFHAGIDVKTWGRRGYAVRALENGYVLRARTSPWGYGRALYEQLADGHVLVLGHLQRFAPRVAARVAAQQEATGTYSVNLWFRAGEIPVTRGDTLAWTGSSGAGPPHLHVELRDADNRPLNPLVHGFQVQDSIPPTLRAVGLIPMGAASQVDGGHDPVVIDLRWNRSSGRFQGARVPVFSGLVGVAVLAYDRADGANNKLAPYRLELRLDGSSLFVGQFGRFAYSDAHQVDLDRTYLVYGGERKPFFNLFVRPGNRLGFYTTGSTRGALSYLAQGASRQVGPGPHELELVAADANGNRSVARLRIVADRMPRLTRIQRSAAHGWTMDLVDGDDIQLTVTAEKSAGRRRWSRVGRSTRRPGPWRWETRGPGAWWRFTVEDAAGAQAFAVVRAAAARYGLTAGASAAGVGPVTSGRPGERAVGARILHRGGSRSAAGRTLAEGPAEDASRVVMADSKAVPGADGAPDEEPAVLQVSRHVHADFVELIIRAVKPLVGVPQVRVGRRSVRVRQVTADEYRAAVVLSAHGPAFIQALISGRTGDGQRVTARMPLSQRAVRPGQARSLVFGDGQARLRFAPESAYRELFPQWEWFLPHAGGELVPVSGGHAFAPLDVSFDHRVILELAYPPRTARPGQLGVYAADDDGRWVFLGSEVDTSARVVRAELRLLGRMALLRDRQPPRITDLRPAPGVRLRDRMPLLSARVEDEGAGIGREKDIRMELDGVPLIAEYDPDEDRVRHQLRTALAPGVHELLVAVLDMAGNQGLAMSRFRVR